MDTHARSRQKSHWRRTLAAAAAVLLSPLAQASEPPLSPLPAAQDAPYLGPLRLQVDATDLDRRVFQVRQQLPVRPGPLTLYFPQYLPGTHGPYGAIERLAGVQIRAGAREIPWLRDAADPYALRLEVPAGVDELQLQFQFLTPTTREGGRQLITREMLNLQWNSVLLYPAGHHASALQVQASVRLPAGWQQASALRVAQQRREGETELLEFQRVSLETLVDSPLFAGAHLRRVPLEAPGSARPVVLNIVADTPELLREISEEQLQAHRRLVEQADRLFGARHFAKYDFLLALSDQLGGIGLEHHESSENGVKPGYFRDWAKRAGSRELLPHEYVHSWNGKFRRPLDLWTPHYNLPMRNSLLWLYEGQTQYWGKLLAARSGLVSAEQAREGLAQMAATAAHRAGRVWRSLQDTTVEPSSGRRGAMPDWRNWQRGADYYDEAALVWLDADTLIREKSGGQRSLDDFARAFFGMEDGRVQPLTYRFDDVVEALERIQPHDWRRFLRERLDRHEPQAPLDGLERAGWRLSWAETESPLAHNSDSEWRSDDFAYSLGLYLKRDGQVDGVLWDSPAWSAGLSRAVQLVAVNGTAYKAERLAAAITANKSGQTPIALLLKEGERYRSITLDYRGGLRYPRLSRIEGTPERLDAGVFKARH